jgi:hypothetical protein
MGRHAPTRTPRPARDGRLRGGALPVTGVEMLQLALLVIALLLVGARLRVRALRRKRAPHVPFEAASARPIVARRTSRREEWSFPDPNEPTPTALLPSTATARRRARELAMSDDRR